MKRSGFSVISSAQGGIIINTGGMNDPSCNFLQHE
jgi:hypothetical protein